MSKNIYDILYQMQESGWTLDDLLAELDQQLDLMRKCPKIRESEAGRLLSLARTDLEAALLRVEKYKSITGQGIPLVFIEDDTE